MPPWPTMNFRLLVSEDGLYFSGLCLFDVCVDRITFDTLCRIYEGSLSLLCTSLAFMFLVLTLWSLKLTFIVLFMKFSIELDLYMMALRTFSFRSVFLFEGNRVGSWVLFRRAIYYLTICGKFTLRLPSGAGFSSEELFFTTILLFRFISYWDCRIGLVLLKSTVLVVFSYGLFSIRLAFFVLVRLRLSLTDTLFSLFFSTGLLVACVMRPSLNRLTSESLRTKLSSTFMSSTD